VTTTAIIATGVANTASVAAALRRVGLDPRVTADPSQVESADLAVLPGVGSFGVGMAMLSQTRNDRVVVERIKAGRPLLAVCLGMQLFGTRSDESPGVAGLSVVPNPVKAFPEGVRTPQFGWNRVVPVDDARFTEGYAYFANSFRFTETPEGWEVAAADHGGKFIAAMQRGHTLACQFHPELSGAWGLGLLRNWVERCGVKTKETAPC